MKTIAFVMLACATGCSDDADIGVSSEPIKCATDGAIADVSGSVKDNGPNGTQQYTFDTAVPSVRTSTGGPTLTLTSGNLLLRFGFYCGNATIDTYGIKGDTQQGLECPLEVASTILGQIEYLPATGGTLIVDETANCFAGRFRVDFGQYGEVSGSFSTPWQ